MFFEIDHLTLYRYSVPVQLGEHLLRFRPLQRVGQRTLTCELQVDPVPTCSEQVLDPWGNGAHRLGFLGSTDRLEIRAHLEVETSEPLIESPTPDFQMPVDYEEAFRALSPYLEPLEEATALYDFIAPLKASAAGSGLAFLRELNRVVHGFYHRGVRLDGPPMRPAQTLAAREGVCRDLTVLFMAACRQLGLATRFVSGYQQGHGTRQIRYLHAWPEVCVPGGGWRGFDPTHGAEVGPEHVAIAAAPTAAAVTPVEGGYCFCGPELNSTLKTEIRISTH